MKVKVNFVSGVVFAFCLLSGSVSGFLSLNSRTYSVTLE